MIKSKRLVLRSPYNSWKRGKLLELQSSAIPRKPLIAINIYRNDTAPGREATSDLKEEVNDLVPSTRVCLKLSNLVIMLFLSCRSHDGSQKWANFHPSPPGSPAGQYQFTPNQTYSLYPQLANTKPFVIKSAKEFDTLGGPLKVPSAEYNADYNVVATIGNANSTLQTKLQKDTAKFWEDGASKNHELSYQLVHYVCVLKEFIVKSKCRFS